MCDFETTFSDVVTARLGARSFDIEIFPNPTPGISTIQLPAEVRGTVRMDVLNAQGQVVATEMFQTDGNASLEVDLSQMAEGVYFLKFDIEGAQQMKQLVLKK